MSTMSEEVAIKEMVEAASTTEAAVRAEATSVVPPMLRQQHHRQALLNKESSQPYAGGTGNLEIKLSNARQTAPNLSLSPLHQTRETGKEDAGCERGHLLLFIIISKE